MADLFITRQLTIPAAEITISFARSGGPGGQNVNKVETKVELRWSPAQSGVLSERDRVWLVQRLAARLTVAGDLIITCDRHRAQGRNREEAEAKLVEVVRLGLERPKRRKPTRPGRGATERRLRSKRERSEKKRNRRPPED